MLNRQEGNDAGEIEDRIKNEEFRSLEGEKHQISYQRSAIRKNLIPDSDRESTCLKNSKDFPKLLSIRGCGGRIGIINR